MSLSSSAAPVKVTMIAETRETHLQWQEEMKAKFEAEHPNVTIELVSTAGTGLTQKMQAMLAAGLPLEIGYMDPWLIVRGPKRESWRISPRICKDPGHNLPTGIRPLSICIVWGTQSMVFLRIFRSLAFSTT